MSTYQGTIEKGRTWSINVQWLMDGTPVDLTGYSLSFTMQLSNGSAWKYQLLSGVAGSSNLTVTSPTTGAFSVTVDANDTAALPIRDLLFIIVATSPDASNVYTVVTGTMNVIYPMRAS